jgi:hypothetical protein
MFYAEGVREIPAQGWSDSYYPGSRVRIDRITPKVLANAFGVQKLTSMLIPG